MFCVYLKCLPSQVSPHTITNKTSLGDRCVRRRCDQLSSDGVRSREWLSCKANIFRASTQNENGNKCLCDREWNSQTLRKHETNKQQMLYVSELFSKILFQCMSYDNIYWNLWEKNAGHLRCCCVVYAVYVYNCLTFVSYSFITKTQMANVTIWRFAIVLPHAEFCCRFSFFFLMCSVRTDDILVACMKAEWRSST